MNHSSVFVTLDAENVKVYHGAFDFGDIHQVVVRFDKNMPPEDRVPYGGGALDLLRYDGIRDLLYDNLEHPRWSDTAGRCLSCGNCTMVCPTCFCSTVEDVTDVSGTQAERVRHWDSCFTSEHSYIHGGATRVTTKARYRQWLTHKLASWIDQFGTSGCVGCGRCITWCPVGIDITEEVRVIRDGEPTSAGSEGD